MTHQDSDDYNGAALVGIGEAARLLGVSRTTVQKMVDSGTLDAVRTAGGHRRILRQSLENHLSARAPSRRGVEGRKLQVLVADDNPLMRQTYEQRVTRWGLPLEVHFCVDAVDALLQIERRRPHVIITDLRMEPFDGFHLLRILKEQPAFTSQWVLVISALTADEIEAKGGLPTGVLLYSKPPQWDRIRGFLEACCLRELGNVGMGSEAWQQLAAESASVGPGDGAATAIRAAQASAGEAARAQAADSESGQRF